jgi:hypothetical protein
MIAVDSENHTKHINTLYDPNKDLNFKADGTYKLLMI